jgi:hypothetical protein
MIRCRVPRLRLVFPRARDGAVVILAVFVAQAVVARPALGEKNIDEHAPMPEPLFNETMTDIDGDEAGEVEFEINGFRGQSLRRGAYAMQGTIEIEWLATRCLGLFVEPLFTQTLDASGSGPRNHLGVNGGLSWKLLQDFRRDFHLQAELGGRYPLDPSMGTDPGDPALPFTLDLRTGFRRGLWTFRGSAGTEAGGRFAHLPVRASIGVYMPFGSSNRYGFWGIEADADGGRRYPVVVALNFIPSLMPLGIPFNIGFGIPWAIGVPGTQPVVGLLVRLFVEGTREVSYAESSKE